VTGKADRAAAPDPAARGIATRAELERRLQALSPTAPQRQLTPGGVQAADAARALRARTVARVEQLQGRLSEAQQRLRADRGKAVIGGHSKQQFDRCR